MVVIDGHPEYAGARPGTSGELGRRVLQIHSALTRLFLRLAPRRWFFSVVKFIERSTVPGILRHYALRKKCLALFAREALRDGITQVVVLGAGLDPLALTLQREFPDGRFWEIDHPATQRLKTEAMGPVDAHRFHFVAVNLVSGEIDLAMLNQSGFDAASRTLWIAEGLLMYFPEAVVAHLLSSAPTLSAPGSRLAFTFMEPRRDRRVRFRNQSRLVDWWLSWRGEPFVWGLERNRISHLAEPWQIDRIVDDKDLHALDSSPGSFSLAAGELICLAELR
jgi:methyltransferase (TIGR00027 family)